MRLLGWFRRPAPVAGRHSRVLAGPSVPGAAASLVSTAAGAVNVDSAALAARSVAPVAPLVAVTPSAPEHRPDPVAAAPRVEAGVTLGFADGVSVELAADDPRVRTFRAAAEALLDAPRV